MNLSIRLLCAQALITMSLGGRIYRRNPARLALLLSGLLQVTLFSPSHCETIGWHPDLTLEPGYGLEYRQQYLLKPRVALLDPGAATNYSGTGSASYSASFSQHQLDMVSRFSLNLNVSAKYGVYSGRVGFSYVDNTSYTGNTLNFVFECNRDYGFTRFRPSGLDPDFVSEITRLRQTLRGQALQKALTERFGDYFISGYKSVGKVVVIYTFNFESQTTARSITASIAGKYKNGVTSVQFQSDVQSFFQQTDSQVSMSYRVFSSDPSRPLLFPTNQITSYDQFTAFSTVVGNYVNNMSPTGAARMEFIVEPMQNLPGYSGLVEGSSSTNQFETGYDRFLDAYGALKQWDQQLTDWTIDNRSISWMNTNGQRLVFTMRKEVADYVKTLEALAKSHFTTGSPLEVPDEIFNYFANFNRIPLPALGRINTWEGAGTPCNPSPGPQYIFIGYLLCGKNDLTREWPFLSVANLRNGSDSGVIAPVWTFGEWEQFSRSYGNPCPSVQSMVRNSTTQPIWAALRTMTNDCRILAFMFSTITAVGNNWPLSTSMAVRDNAGNIVDSIPWITARTPSCESSLAASPEADLSVGAVALSASATLDSTATCEYAITNNGPGAAYGVEFSMPVPEGMQAQSVTGSQGQGIVTNNTVQFDVGPLASGSVVLVRISFVPLRTGLVAGGGAAIVASGQGLNDSKPGNNTADSPALAVNPPTLSVTKGTNCVELNWISETGQLFPQTGQHLIPPIPWTLLTNGIVSDGGRKTLRVPVAGPSQFFRLQGPAQ